ncbi:MAG: response regulator [Bacteroidales bacterium]|nr:response regulator [Bacteroidales bacterium]
MEKLKIIYIEDNPEDADLARFLLSEELDRPFEIRRVETKEEFFNTAKTFYPDIILCDVTLPAYSGFEALEDAKSAFSDIPFIMVTGTLSEEMAADSIKSGAWDYVIKERLIRLAAAVKGSLVLKAEKDKQATILEKLRESEERFALAMQGSQDGVWDWDTKTNMQYLSGRWNEMLGFGHSEVTMDHDDWLDYIHPEDRADTLKKFKKHLSGKSDHFLAEFRVKMKDNSYKWIMSRGKAIFDKTGKPYRMAGSHTDISERKTTEIKLRTLSMAIHNAPVSVVMTNKSGDIEYVNPKFSAITGYQPEEVLGKNPRVLNSGLQADEFYKELWDTILAGKEWKGVFINKKKSGDLFWESASIASITGSDNEISHFIAIKEDITGRVKSEEELIKAMKKAEESDRLKSSFLANMSHEIRTPMNGIIGFAELITKPDLTNDKKKYYADIIKSSTSRLLRLLTDIIDYSKIDAGQIEIHEIPFNLNLLIDQVISEAKLNIQNTSVSDVEVITCKALTKDSAVFISDEIRLKQILMNLINNALKFTSEGYIEVGYEDPSKDGLILYVKDTGIGISKDKQSLIFERFRQVDETSKRSFEGSGLGLSITKGLVEALGGKLWLESEIDKGTTFYVNIPIKSSELPGREGYITSEEGDFDITDMKILIVEDDPANRQLLEEFLGGLDTDVRFAMEGQEAIGIFKQTPDFDLVLMDMKLPDMSGIQVTQILKKINPQVKVIAQTAYAMSNDREKFIKDGCDGYIEKPYDIVKLFRIIQSVCRP